MVLNLRATARLAVIGLLAINLMACAQDEAIAEGDGAEAEIAETAVGGCAAGEPVIFSCQIESGKQVSFCVTQGAGEDAGISFAQFRMGDPDNAPDLVWPRNPGDGAMHWHSVPYSGGGEAQIGFTDGDMQYIAYSSVIRTNFEAGEPNNPVFSDGLVTLARGNESETQSCVGENDVPLDYDLAQLHAAQAHDLLVIREWDDTAD